MKDQNNQPLVSFIVLGWNNRQLLDECFKSIQEQNYKNFRVIYVDNGSTDGSVDYVKKNYPKIIVSEAGENLGFAMGNNVGLKKAFEDEQCRYVALLNTDAVVAPDWLKKLVNFAEGHPKGASFQSPTYDYYDHEILDSRGITIDYCGRAVQLGYRETSSNLSTRQVFGVNAAAALYSRTFLDEQPFGSDYFDSDMWMYLEDVDLAARAIIMGWENWLLNESGAYHMGSASSSKNPGFSVYMVYRNNLLLLIKNLPLGILLKTFPGAAFTDLRTLIQLVRNRNYRTAKAILKGRFSSIPMMPRFISKRRQLRKYRQVQKTTLQRLMRAR